MWAAFIIIFGLALLLTAIDVAVTSRLRLHSRGWDMAWALWYLLLALGAATLLYGSYDHHWLGLGISAIAEIRGPQAAKEFLVSFLWLVAFDVDGVFVVSAIFGRLNITPAARRVVLAWSGPISLAVRGLAIAASVWMLGEFPWVRFAMAGVLVLAALRMLIIRQEAVDPDRSLFIRVLRWLLPTRPGNEPNAMIGVQAGRLTMTPLVAALVLVATADVYLAIDSVPAAFAISRDPVILFAASAIALPCLRSLYAALDEVRGWLRWVKIGLAVTLGYAAVVVAAPPSLRPTTLPSLMVLAVSLGSGLVLALATGKAARRATDTTSPIGADAERLTRETLSTARKTIVFVVGMALLIVGLIMLPGPGPGLPVTFAALAILGNEFAWAKRLVDKYRGRAMQAAERSAAVARKRFSPWVLVPLIGGTIAVFVLIPQFLPVPIEGAILGAIPTVLGQVAWGYIAFFRKTGAATPPLPEPGATGEPPER
ncbi:MAG: PGPGW domain-containing protein [Phycisphaerales bacterium]|jgi:tellurite resistance protein TerC